MLPFLNENKANKTLYKNKDIKINHKCVQGNKLS